MHQTILQYFCDSVVQSLSPDIFTANESVQEPICSACGAFNFASVPWTKQNTKWYLEKMESWWHGLVSSGTGKNCLLNCSKLTAALQGFLSPRWCLFHSSYEDKLHHYHWMSFIQGTFYSRGTSVFKKAKTLFDVTHMFLKSSFDASYFGFSFGLIKELTAQV